MNKLPVIDRYAARLLMVSFFLPMQLQVWATMATGVYFVLRTFLTKQSVPKRNYAWALFLSGSFLLYLLSFPLTPPEYRHWLAHLSENRVSLLFMPFVFAIAGPAFGALIMDELLFFVYGCFITCAAANMDFAYHYFAKGGIHNLTHVQYRTIIHQFTDLHPTYMAMYLVFSICILIQSAAFNNRAARIIKYGLVYAQLIFLLALLAKTPMIALVIIFLHYMYLHRKTLYRFKGHLIGLAASIAGAWFFIPFFSQRVKEMLPFLGMGKAANANDNSVYARQLIWNIDTSLLKYHWLMGVGPGRIQRALEERYFLYSLNSAFPVAYYDPHNEYFSTWISFGILGIVLLVAILVVQYVKAMQTRNYLYLYLLIILATTFFTETVLSLQRGVMLYAVLTSLMFFSPLTARKKNRDL